MVPTFLYFPENRYPPREWEWEKLLMGQLGRQD